MRVDSIVVSRMKEQRLNGKRLAEKLGIAESTLSKKLNGKSEFDLEEVRLIVKILNLSDAEILEIVRR